MFLRDLIAQQKHEELNKNKEKSARYADFFCEVLEFKTLKICIIYKMLSVLKFLSKIPSKSEKKFVKL